MPPRRLPFAPKFSDHVARFTDDDRDTRTYARFDPLALASAAFRAGG